jgi:glycosyltransferase involved in cell wall biosynthesis
VEQRRLHCFAPQRLSENHFQSEWKEEDGVPTLRLRGWNTLANTLPGALISCALMRRQVAHYIRRFGRPDLIHAHSALWAGYAASRLNRKYGVPYVVTEHSTAFPSGSVPYRFRAYATAAFAGASRVLAVGERLKSCLGDFLPGGRIDVIPNLINTAYFHLPPEPRGTTPFVFLSIANLLPHKGMATLIEAFAAAFAGHPETRLAIAGEGPELAKLKSLCAKLEISGLVDFPGRLSRQQVRAALWAANAFVLASHVETFGVVFIEAMATGLPVIGTRSGGPEDFITNENGLLVEPGDVQGITDSLRHMRHNTEYSARAIRELTERRFSETSVTALLSRIYDDSLRAGKSYLS